MPRSFRKSNSHEAGDILASVESLEAFARDHGPGRYDIDEHSDDLFLGSKHVARAWGHVIDRQDGSATMEPPPWLK
jgi:hypothetical protein